MSSEAGSEQALLVPPWSLVCLLWRHEPGVTSVTVSEEAIMNV